jgi:hypothetical protein
MASGAIGVRRTLCPGASLRISIIVRTRVLHSSMESSTYVCGIILKIEVLSKIFRLNLDLFKLIFEIIVRLVFDSNIV